MSTFLKEIKESEINQVKRINKTVQDLKEDIEASKNKNKIHKHHNRNTADGRVNLSHGK